MKHKPITIALLALFYTSTAFAFTSASDTAEGYAELAMGARDTADDYSTAACSDLNGITQAIAFDDEEAAIEYAESSQNNADVSQNFANLSQTYADEAAELDSEEEVAVQEWITEIEDIWAPNYEPAWLEDQRSYQENQGHINEHLVFEDWLLNPDWLWIDVIIWEWDNDVYNGEIEADQFYEELLTDSDWAVYQEDEEYRDYMISAYAEAFVTAPYYQDAIRDQYTSENNMDVDFFLDNVQFSAAYNHLEDTLTTDDWSAAQVNTDYLSFLVDTYYDALGSGLVEADFTQSYTEGLLTNSYFETNFATEFTQGSYLNVNSGVMIDPAITNNYQYSNFNKFNQMTNF